MWKIARRGRNATRTVVGFGVRMGSVISAEDTLGAVIRLVTVMWPPRR